MSDLIDVGESNWDAEVKNSTRPVLVDFFATWCGPCKQLHPTIEKLAAEYKGRATVAQVDVDQNTRLCQRMGIQAMPTVKLFRAGSETAEQTFVGVKGEGDYRKALDEILPLWGGDEKGEIDRCHDSD